MVCPMFSALIAIVGPTAVGKTEISIKLAERIGAEIISADSRQVYRFMDIGTAKPSPEERRRIAHHMIDVVNPNEEYTVADYKSGAEIAINLVIRKGKIPILTGGSGLYVRAVIDGIFSGPGSNPDIRKGLEAQAEKSGLTSLYDRLRQVDPAASSRIHPGDKRRIVRALEIYEITGRPISVLQEEGKEKNTDFNPIMIGLNRSREELYGRIDKRVEKIFQQGFVEEVKTLLEKGYGKNLISMEALGYREVVQFLEGKTDIEQTKSKIKLDTHHYARRQLTWFRKDKRITWFDLQNEEKPDKTVETICGFMDKTIGKY